MAMITLVFGVMSDSTFHSEEPNKTKLVTASFAAIKEKSEK